MSQGFGVSLGRAVTKHTSQRDPRCHGCWWGVPGLKRRGFFHGKNEVGASPTGRPDRILDTLGLFSSGPQGLAPGPELAEAQGQRLATPEAGFPLPKVSGLPNCPSPPIPAQPQGRGARSPSFVLNLRNWGYREGFACSPTHLTLGAQPHAREALGWGHLLSGAWEVREWGKG